MKPDNAENSFKCSRCGFIFSRGDRSKKECPSCGYNCTETTCSSLGASNEDY